ncbi:MAG: hypothetical protein OEZ58_15370 [Gammaproteobacteria bacterium]|nr:hypothetical protein [Gammaproteobacteria bacterium]MDH5730375.1 hypothetical protein [Gammaproteobacteria bacterium]
MKTKNYLTYIFAFIGSLLFTTNTWAEEYKRFGIGASNGGSGDLYLHFRYSEHSMWSARVYAFGERFDNEGESGGYNQTNLLIDFRRYLNPSTTRWFYTFRFDTWVIFNTFENADKKSENMNIHFAPGAGFGLEHPLTENLFLLAQTGFTLGISPDGSQLSLRGPGSGVMLNFYW